MTKKEALKSVVNEIDKMFECDECVLNEHIEEHLRIIENFALEAISNSSITDTELQEYAKKPW